MPEGYNLPFNNPIATDEQTCQNSCYTSANCVQYVYFSTATDTNEIPSSVNARSCYLQNRLTVATYVNKHRNAKAISLKSRLKNRY